MVKANVKNMQIKMTATNETSASTPFQKLHLDALRAVVGEVLGDRAPAQWHGVAQVEEMMRKMPHGLTAAQTVAVHALSYYEAIDYASQHDGIDAETQDVFDSREAHASAANALNLLATLVTESQGVICRRLANSLLVDAPANQMAAPNQATEISVTTTAPDWRAQIRDEATAWASERRVKGMATTKLTVALEMVTWCKNNEVMTDTGKSVQLAYIKRHVLNTWKPPR